MPIGRDAPGTRPRDSPRRSAHGERSRWYPGRSWKTPSLHSSDRRRQYFQRHSPGCHYPRILAQESQYFCWGASLLLNNGGLSSLLEFSTPITIRTVQYRVLNTILKFLVCLGLSNRAPYGALQHALREHLRWQWVDIASRHYRDLGNASWICPEPTIAFAILVYSGT